MRWFWTVVIALVAGFGGAALWSVSGFGGGATRDYLLANPEVLPEAIEVLQQREQRAKIEPLRSELEKPFPGAILGNPDGAVSLVMFSDYACTYCKMSHPDVEQLIAGNPDLKVVVREYPILRPESADAARMALAAAQQDKYREFHDAMFRLGPPTQESIAAAAEAADLDVAQAREAIESGAFEAQLQSNALLANQVGITGTPGWIVGNQALHGAVGRAALADAIGKVRES